MSKGQERMQSQWLASSAGTLSPASREDALNAGFPKVPAKNPATTLRKALTCTLLQSGCTPLMDRVGISQSRLGTGCLNRVPEGVQNGCD